MFGLLVLAGLPRARAAVNPTDADSDPLGEIVVSAEKYNSTMQATPISMSAITGEQLAAQGISTVEDLVREVPGISMRSAGPGQTEYEARGLASNGGAAPTVGFYLDEVPLSPPAMAEVGKVVIDPNLYDIDRIEVLRGPQGTLYGSGSMGGTIRVITNQPKLGYWEGSFQGDLSGTEGGGLNGSGNFMLNIPMGDLLALRVVGSDSWRSGWIDRITVSPFPEDVGTSRGNVLAAPVQNVVTDANTEHLQGARASLLFEPNSNLSVIASALYQRINMGGYDEFDSPPGPQYLAHYEAYDLAEPIEDLVHVYSLTVTANLGFADLTSATAYWDRTESQTQDASESISVINGVYPYVPVTMAEVDESRQISEELRLTSRGDTRLHWVAGAFVSDLNSVYLPYNPLPNAVFAEPGNPVGQVADADNPYRIEQTALFADGTFSINDTVRIATGLRYYRYQSRQFTQEWGYDTPTPVPETPVLTEASDSGLNPRFNLSYSPSDDLNMYAIVAKGFRPGGANLYVPPPNLPPHCGGAPTPSFGPDSVWNYEVGEKARLLDRRLTINGDFYYIEWNNIQQTLLLNCGYQYIANAGTARTFGSELEVVAKVADEWLISASGHYTDARVTHPSPEFIAFLTSPAAVTMNGEPYCAGAANCTAPIMNVPRTSASASVTYAKSVWDGYNFSARLVDTYTGPTYDEAFFYAIRLPPYNLMALRFGLSTARWSAYLFIDNLTNKVAEMTANNTSFQFNIPGLVRYTTNQPRTFGTQLNYKF